MATQNRLRLLIVANNAVFAIPKGAAVRDDEDDDLEEDLLIAAQLAEERQQSGEGKCDIWQHSIQSIPKKGLQGFCSNNRHIPPISQNRMKAQHARAVHRNLVNLNMEITAQLQDKLQLLRPGSRQQRHRRRPAEGTRRQWGHLCACRGPGPCRRGLCGLRG